MLIETTVRFDTKEDAEDNLAGVKTLPGFRYAYIRTPATQSQKFDLILIFDCNGDSQNLQRQRAIESFTIAEEIITIKRGNLTPEHQTMLDLLSYPNPEGLHPNEARWRNFARSVLRPKGSQFSQSAAP